MKPSIKKRWAVIGTAAALGAGAVGASALALNDQGPATESAAAVTLDSGSQTADEKPNPDQGTSGEKAADQDPSPESPDSPNESAVDSADSADDSPSPAPQRVGTVQENDTANTPGSANSPSSVETVNTSHTADSTNSPD